MSAAKEKILEAADSLFGEVGFDAATTRQIAERSAVNKALIHYHFGNKDDLYHALLDRYYQRLGDTLRAALTAPGTVRERFLAMIDAYVDFLGANRNFSRMVQREASGGRHVDRIVGHMVPLFRQGSALLELAYPATRGGAMSGAQLLISFYGMIVTYFTYAPVVEKLLDTDPLDPANLELRKRHLTGMVDLVVGQLEANAAAPAADPSDPERV